MSSLVLLFQEDPQAIMQDVVDQAQLVYYIDCHQAVGSERNAQRRLMRRLKRIGYDVEDEVQLKSRVLRTARVERDARNRMDLLINRKVLVELKHANQLEEAKSQVIRYLMHKNMKKVCHHGLLVGFPKNRLENPVVTCILGLRGRSKLTEEETISFEYGMKPSPAIYNRCCTSLQGS